MRCSLPLSLLLPIAVSASPIVNSKVLNALFCKVNIGVIKVFEKEAGATSYCSSFLSIPTSTISKTVTETPSSIYTTVPATITTEPVTVTEQRTETTTTDSTSTSTVIVTESRTTTIIPTTITLNCLSSAYTYAPPVAVVSAPAAQGPGPEKRLLTFKKPTGIPKTWGSAYVSSACACLAIPTPSTTTTLTATLVPGTITVTTTDVVTPTTTALKTTTEVATNTIIEPTTTTTTIVVSAFATPTTIASNGVTYRKYTHPYDADRQGHGFTVDFFKGKSAEWSGTLQSLQFTTTGDGPTLQLPDHAPFDSSFSGVLMQGFFIAKQTGTYRFTSQNFDNWAYMWVGDVAYSLWNKENASLKSEGAWFGPSFPGSFSIVLRSGDAIPITYLWANGGGPGKSGLEIRAPSGAIIEHVGSFVQACGSGVFA